MNSIVSVVIIIGFIVGFLIYTARDAAKRSRERTILSIKTLYAQIEEKRASLYRTVLKLKAEVASTGQLESKILNQYDCLCRDLHFLERCFEQNKCSKQVCVAEIDRVKQKFMELEERISRSRKQTAPLP